MVSQGRLSLNALVIIAFAGIVTGLVLATGNPYAQLALIALPLVAWILFAVLRRAQVLGLILLFLFHTNIDFVLYESRLCFVFVVVACAYMALLLMKSAPRLPMALPLRIHCAIPALMLGISAVSHDTSGEVIFGFVIRMGYVYVVLFVVWFTVSSEELFRQISRVMTWGGVVAALVNIIEFYDRQLIDLSSLPGRSAGLLATANASASMIVVSLLVSYFSPSRFVLLARIVMFIGMFTTFSRFSLLMVWPLLFYLEISTRNWNFRQALAVALTLIPLLWITEHSSDLVERFSSESVKRAFTRVANLQDGQVEDASTNYRLDAVRINLDRFLESPLTGNGLGSASVIASPHNQYLLLMAETGFLPALTYFVFLLVLGARALSREQGKDRATRLALFTYLFAYMFVTHNALNLKHVVIAYALICASASRFPGEVTESADAHKRLTPTGPLTPRSAPSFLEAGSRRPVDPRRATH